MWVAGLAQPSTGHTTASPSAAAQTRGTISPQCFPAAKLNEFAAPFVAAIRKRVAETS
jgi:hypothetical protein